VRIVQGVPVSWDPAIATTKLPSTIFYATWSTCNRFIAISQHFMEEVQILDAVTLKKLRSLRSLGLISHHLAFSPDGHTLTGFGGKSESFTCWDLQTGVPVCKSPEWPAGYICSTTYSGCGRMLGILFRNNGDYDMPFVISTYDSHSGTPMCHHQIKGSVMNKIWAYGECVRFATLDVWSIIIWEVEFTSTCPPMQVRSLPTPDNFDPWGRFLFHPTPPRIAFNNKKSLLVWDVYHLKLLLDYADFGPGERSFSSDAHFFACVTTDGEIYLWEESPTGYTLYQKIVLGRLRFSELLLSPDGQSVLVLCDSTIQLLHTQNSTTSALSVLTEPRDYYTRDPILVFSQDRSLAVTTQMYSNIVTVLNLRSGLPCLNIDTGMGVYGVGVTRNIIAVVCDGKVITWNVPVGDSVHDANVDINDSIQTTSFHYPGHTVGLGSASISPDLNHFIVSTDGVRLYNMSTGGLLGGSDLGSEPCFTSDGHEVWGSSPEGMERWAVVQGGGSSVTGLKRLDPSGVPSGVLPWQSPHGCKVADDGWIISSSGKQLFWLPHHWRSYQLEQVWGGQFLAILDKSLPEVVILELLEV